jgi:hypothetical protein
MMVIKIQGDYCWIKYFDIIFFSFIYIYGGVICYFKDREKNEMKLINEEI